MTRSLSRQASTEVKATAHGAATVKNKAQQLIKKFDLHNAPGHLLRRSHSRARAIFEELIGRKTGLSKQQMALLFAIAHAPAATHAQLSEETGFDRNTLADALNRLISKGFALRTHSKSDGRAYDIQLTQAGMTQLELLVPIAFEVQSKILEPLPEELRPQFLDCLRILSGLEPVTPELLSHVAKPGRRHGK
jgi:DNA-binding MarR family transcriptional regulator